MAQAPAEEKNDASIPKTMKCVRLHAYDQDMAKALKVEECDVPVAGDNQVLVKVYSASLNPVDWKIAKGYLQGLFKPPLPLTIGNDFAGVIVGLGNGVAKAKPALKIGTRVAGKMDLFTESGSFAEYLATNIVNVAILDDSVSFDTGAAMPLVTLTSYQALMDHTEMKDTKNLKILVLGGSSSTGMAALQVAKIYGASVIATTSSQEGLCKTYGATKVYNYKDKNVPLWYDDLKGQDFDIIYDCVGNPDSWFYSQAVFKQAGGKFITIAGPGKAPEKPSDAYGKDKCDVNEKNSYLFFLAGDCKGLEDLFALVNDKKLGVEIDEDSPYTIDTLFDMLKKSIDHKAHGKLVMQIVVEKQF